MTLRKCVNGTYVDLTPAEEAAQLAEWVANDQATAAKAAQEQREQKRASALAALQDKVLAEALLDPNAPQAVKDYATVLQAKP